MIQLEYIICNITGRIAEHFNKNIVIILFLRLRNALRTRPTIFWIMHGSDRRLPNPRLLNDS
jgi:hypothetical protein